MQRGTQARDVLADRYQPRYDKKIAMGQYQTYLTNAEVDRFNMSTSIQPLILDRNQPAAFKLEFEVNRDIVKPATVRIGGLIEGIGPIEKASFQIK